MGVTRRLDHLRPINVEDEVNDVIDRFNYADFDFSDSDTEVVENGRDVQLCDGFPLSRSRKNKERRAERKMRRFLDVESIGVNSKNNIGARKQRRSENARILMSFADKDDICTDFSDIVPHGVTAFERLFLDHECMQIWNDFIERDEAEQRQILEREESGHGCGWFIVGGKAGTSSIPSHGADGRKHHPAYCGKACFERLDGKSKRLLSGKRLPWGFIDQLEGELLSFFSTSSPTGTSMKNDAVYVADFDNSFERALGHAVAQFLMLKSKSVTVRGSTTRLTEFRNPRAFFIPPHTRLVPYLLSLRPDPVEATPHSKLKGAEHDTAESRDSSFNEIDSSLCYS